MNCQSLATGHRLLTTDSSMLLVKNWRSLILLFSLTLLPALAREPHPASLRWQNPHPQGNPLYAVGFSDERRGIAVGRDGAILRTSDGGRGWQLVRTAVGTPLYGLAVHGQRAWAVGARGIIITS